MKMVLLFLLATVFYAPAEYYSKLFAKTPSIIHATKVQFFYIMSTFVWMYIVHIKKDLFVASLAWFGVGITISFVVGVVMFSEVIKPVNLIGAMLAIVASILLML